MGKMSQLHADSAPERAEAAESDLLYHKHAMTIIAGRVEAIRAALADPAVCVTSDVIDELHAIATDLRNVAGPDPEDAARFAAAVLHDIETGEIGF